jgi:hypothetical protein
VCSSDGREVRFELCGDEDPVRHTPGDDPAQRGIEVARAARLDDGAAVEQRERKVGDEREDASELPSGARRSVLDELAERGDEVLVRELHQLDFATHVHPRPDF